MSLWIGPSVNNTTVNVGSQSRLGSNTTKLARHPIMTPLPEVDTYGDYGRPIMRCCQRTTTTTAAQVAKKRVLWPKEFPMELAFEVFKYLPQGDLARACRVSRYC